MLINLIGSGSRISKLFNKALEKTHVVYVEGSHHKSHARQPVRVVRPDISAVVLRNHVRDGVGGDYFGSVLAKYLLLLGRRLICRTRGLLFPIICKHLQTPMLATPAQSKSLSMRSAVSIACIPQKDWI